eukprot:15365582-Ditylum_brightwellii.AAC.2
MQHSVQNPNLGLSITSVVTEQVIHSNSTADCLYTPSIPGWSYFVSGSNANNISLSHLSIFSKGSEPHDPKTSYLPEAGDKKGDFSTNNVTKEENEILDYNSNIDGEKIEDLHNIFAIAKELKQRFKEEEEEVLDDPWINGILLKKGRQYGNNMIFSARRLGASYS